MPLKFNSTSRQPIINGVLLRFLQTKVSFSQYLQNILLTCQLLFVSKPFSGPRHQSELEHIYASNYWIWLLKKMLCQNIFFLFNCDILKSLSGFNVFRLVLLRSPVALIKNYVNLFLAKVEMFTSVVSCGNFLFQIR